MTPHTHARAHTHTHRRHHHEYLSVCLNFALPRAFDLSKLVACTTGPDSPRTQTNVDPGRFNGGVKTYAQENWGKLKNGIKQQCTNPRSRIVGQAVCCDKVSGKIKPQSVGQCLFSYETVTFATAEKRCAAEFKGSGVMCALTKYGGNSAGYSCSKTGAQAILDVN